MRLMFLVICILTLTGCLFNTRTETTFIYPDKTWTKEVESTTPPDKAALAAAEPATAIGMIGEYARSQDKQLETCNAQLETIRSWVDAHQTESKGK